MFPNVFFTLLLIVNLALQIFDGAVSYHVLAQGIPELNPLVAALIQNWGTPVGLGVAKSFAVVLLLFVFTKRQRFPRLVLKGLSLTAAVYGLHCMAWSYELLRHGF